MTNLINDNNLMKDNVEYAETATDEDKTDEIGECCTFGYSPLQNWDYWIPVAIRLLSDMQKMAFSKNRKYVSGVGIHTSNSKL